jgi:dUTP pyrophosphatase
MNEIKIMKLHEGAIIPTRAYPNDAGLDLYSLFDCHIEYSQGKTMRTGIAVLIPDGYVGLLNDRSSLARRGLKVLGGVIDSGYTGEIHVVARNIAGEKPISIVKGDRIAQLIIMPIVVPKVLVVTELPMSERGKKGFGSTGR